MKVLRYTLAMVLSSFAIIFDTAFIAVMYMIMAIELALSFASDALSKDVYEQQHETEMWLMSKTLGWIFKVVDINKVVDDMTK